MREKAVEEVKAKLEKMSTEEANEVMDDIDCCLIWRRFNNLKIKSVIKFVHDVHSFSFGSLSI